MSLVESAVGNAALGEGQRAVNPFSHLPAHLFFGRAPSGHPDVFECLGRSDTYGCRSR
jgi:hypothetical protein